MKTLRVVFAICILLFTAATARSADVKISGKVTDTDAKPVEFASVRIAGTAIGTNTDLKGDYQLNVAKADTIEVVFSCLGFQSVTRKLIDAQGDITLNVTLRTDDTLLDEVEVIGFKNTINGMQTVDPTTIKTSPDVSGGSVEAMISTMGGVSQKNEMS